MSPARSVAWAWLVVAIASCAAPEDRTSVAGPSPSPKEVDEEELDEVVVDGRYLYTRNCAGCHNDNGDGLGPTIVQLGKKARSFAEGHFAFGNTRESIFRTIGSGVPGSSPMPGFAGILSDEERWLVVDYVRTLMPAEPEVDEAVGILRVEKSPLVVRGSLPSIVEGAPEFARGLVIGTPGGLTFEYRTDDVRLLGVRRGEFVDRRDWNDRGGSRLRPLGEVIWTAQAGDPDPSIAVIRDEARLALTARLTSSWIRGDGAGLTYTWSLAAKNTAERFRVTVEESCGIPPASAGVGFTRRLVMRSERDDASVLVNLAGSSKDEPWVHGVAGEEVQLVGLPTRDLPADGWIVGRRSERDFECVHVRGPKGSRLVVQPGALGVIVPLPAGKDVVLDAMIVMTSEESPELLERISKEIR